MIITSHAPRDVFRRKTKKFRKETREKRYGGKKSSSKHGRKPRKHFGNKYMTNVLSYINEEEEFIDRIVLDTREFKEKSARFAQLHTLMHDHRKPALYVLELFAKDAIRTACEEEFTLNIEPNLTRAKFSTLIPQRLHTWTVLCDKVGFPDCKRAQAVKDIFPQFSKQNFVSLVEMFKQWPALMQWKEDIVDQKLPFGKFSSFSVDDSKKFTALVRDANLPIGIWRFGQFSRNVFGPAGEGDDYESTMNFLYYEIIDLQYDTNPCAMCKQNFWAHEMMELFPLSAEANSEEESVFHCPECLRAEMLDKKSSTTFGFCDSKLFCNPTLKPSAYEFFETHLQLPRHELEERLRADFELLVMSKYRELPGQILESETKEALDIFRGNFHTLNRIWHRSMPNAYFRDELSGLEVRVEDLIKMVDVKSECAILDGKIDDLTKLIFCSPRDYSKINEQCKAVGESINNCLRNRPACTSSSSPPELFGMNMNDVLNMKLQRAKDVLMLTYDIASECSICMSTASHDEKHLALHNGLEKDVSEWTPGRHRSNFRLPCFTCKDCFNSYLGFKKALGKPALRCPGMNCECFLSKSELKALAPSAYADYKSALMRFALKRVKNFRTCPNADCSASLVLDIDCNVEKVSCMECSWDFCPHCNDSPHVGMTCEEMRRQRHAERWGETKDYMENETKQCPFCLAWIEKNGGCNHMTCHHCRGEFCWLCFGNWKTHISCEEKQAVVRRPFNELYPDWLQKSKKKILPRFSVGKHVSFECKSSFQTKIARVVEVVEDLPGMYLVEPVNGSFDNPLRIEESQLRGYNKILPDVVRFGEASIANEEAAYASFLEGFESDSEENDGCKGPCACSMKKPLVIVVEDAFPPNETIGQSLQIPFDGEYYPGSLELSKEVSELSFVRQQMRRARLAKLREHDDSEEEESSSIDGHFPHSCDEECDEDESLCSSSVAFWFPSSESESESEDSDDAALHLMFGSDSSCGFDSDDEESSS